MASRELECGMLHATVEAAAGQHGVYAHASDAKGEDTAIASIVTLSLEFRGSFGAAGGVVQAGAAEAAEAATTVFVLHRFLVLGVFDGHAGKAVSHWLRSHYLAHFLVPALLDAAAAAAAAEAGQQRQQPQEAQVCAPEEGQARRLTAAHCSNRTPIGCVCVDVDAALYASFAAARDRVLLEPSLTRSGSTGVVVVRDLQEAPASRLHCACYGDSKALLFLARDGDGEGNGSGSGSGGGGGPLAVFQRSLCVMHTAEDEVAQQFARDNGGSVGIYWNGERGVCCVDAADLGRPGVPVPPLVEGHAVFRMSTSANPQATLCYGSKAMSFNFSRSFGDRNIAHLLQQEPQVVHTVLCHAAEAPAAPGLPSAAAQDPRLPEVRVVSAHGCSVAGVLVASDGLFERREKLRPDEEEINQETAEQFFSLCSSQRHASGLGPDYARAVRALVEYARAKGSNDDITAIYHPLAP